jgi:hypothetical protein
MKARVDTARAWARVALVAATACGIGACATSVAPATPSSGMPASTDSAPVSTSAGDDRDRASFVDPHLASLVVPTRPRAPPTPLETPSCDSDPFRVKPSAKLAPDGPAPFNAPIPWRAVPDGDPLNRGPLHDRWGFYEVDGPAPAPRTADDAPLELRLTGPSEVATGEPLHLALTFVDTGSAPVVVVKPIDGTFEHLRDPAYDLYLRDEASGVVYRLAPRGSRCGNTDPAKPRDYVTLGPHASSSSGAIEATHLTHATVERSGTYTAWVAYRFCGHIEGFSATRDFVRTDTLRGVHASNAIALTVR